MDESQMSESVLAIGRVLRDKGWTLATAESCTGGLVGHLLTSVSGSSEWYQGGVVVYANQLKEKLLGVPGEVIAEHGAVSRETVRAMARGVTGLCGCQVGLAVSGIAGPTGGTPDKPVGTVWLAWTGPDGEASRCLHFQGDREQVKQASARTAIQGLFELLSTKGQGG